MHSNQYPNLFRPLKLRGLTMKNRIMSAPNMLFHTIDGRPTEYYVRYLEHKARGGAGIVTLGEANVCDGGNHTPGMETTEENLAWYGEMAAAIHEHGAIASVELTHGGMRIKPQYNTDPDKFVGPVDTVNMHGAKIRAMTAADMEYVAAGFAETAAYYFRAGFDTALIHAGHSWLLTQFLSPVVNRRTDEYGGSLENQMRFPLYVLKTIRERVGPDRPLMIRISGAERVPGGFEIEDMIAFLERAQEYVDLAEVSTDNIVWQFATTYMPPGQNVALAEAIKSSGRVNIPVFTMGSILTPEQGEGILAAGRADGVSMSRALISDPFLPRKAALGRSDEIIPCLRCLNCTDSDNMTRHFVCSVNPLLAREARRGFGDEIGTAKNRRKVLIVGGGPAGMQAAITARERGHEVILAEQSGSLGGLLRFTDTDSLKHDLRRFKDYLIRMTYRSGAKILLNTFVTAELAESLRPDEIIVAAGSAPIVPRHIPGIEGALHATEVYFSPEKITGDRIVIIGGGLIGIETGLHLRNLGRDVTVLEMRDDYAVDAKNVYKIGLMHQVGVRGLEVITGACVRAVTDTGVTYEKDGAQHTAVGDRVLYAVGMAPNEGTYFDLYDRAAFVAHAGDCKAPGKVDGAVHGGFFAAMDVGLL